MSPIKKTLTLTATLLLMAAPFVVFLKAQAITDWWELRNYTAPAAVASLATQDTMTPYSRRVFYVNHPQLVSNVAVFRQDCTTAEQTIVLGCYRSNQAGIFVYNVSDSRLNGVQQVTSAHEMLHAAYDRLSSKEKNYIDGLLQNYYQNDLKDQRLIDTINSYRQTEPNDVVNEMHSVFGTEAPNLPPPLENYYKKYFANRGAVVAFAQNYEGEFASRKNQIETYDQQLTQMKQDIGSLQAALSAQSGQIDADRAKLDAQRSAGQIEAYNAGVASFNAEVDAYNAGVHRLQSEIASYNALVEQRNSIASALASLDQAIDTRLSTQSSQ